MGLKYEYNIRHQMHFSKMDIRSTLEDSLNVKYTPHIDNKPINGTINMKKVKFPRDSSSRYKIIHTPLNAKIKTQDNITKVVVKQN
jgi:hypothetical protein